MSKGLDHKTSVSFLFFLLMAVVIKAQDDKEEPKLLINGYVKEMFSVTSIADSTLIDNLIHNRINFKWYPSTALTGFLEIRNRMFYGDQVEWIPNYGDLIDVDNDYLDLSIIWHEGKRTVWHSIIDRAYLQWVRNNWEIRLGRQRINWGTNLVWNPNDIFNAYSYFDFDYEERPAVDALRIQYYTGFASSIQVAVKAAESRRNFSSALLWKLNKGGYDIQLLGGYSRGDLVMGAGWAGNIKTAGFKGEISYFEPVDTKISIDQAFLTSVTLDYSFKNSLYIMVSGLFNSNGSKSITIFDQINFTTSRLTARELSPFKYNTIIQGAYQLHPLVNTSMAAMFFPGTDYYYFYPVVSVSLFQNVDLDLISQFFYENLFKKNVSGSQAYFLRLKWSF